MKPLLQIVKQISPETGRPFRIIENYPTSEGIRSRICSGVHETIEQAEARRDQLEAAAAYSTEWVE